MAVNQASSLVFAWQSDSLHNNVLGVPVKSIISDNDDRNGVLDELHGWLEALRSLSKTGPIVRQSDSLAV